MAAALHLARYLKGTINVGPFYPSNNSLDLYTYMDADWGNCVFCRKSLTGYCAFLGKSLTSWKTKKQKTTSKSSAESEYRAMSDTTNELVWLANLIRDFQVTPTYQITLFCDNKAAQYIAANPVFHNRTKHLDIDCHHVRDKLQEGFLQTSDVSTTHQLADLFTKPLPSHQHRQLSSKLGLISMASPT